MTDTILVCLLATLIAGITGYGLGRTAIGADCQRLGSFYVAETVFECKERK